MEHVRCIVEDARRECRMITPSGIGVFHTNAVGVCDGLLEGLPGITGISCDKVLGRIWLQMVFSEDRDRVCMEWYQSIIRNRVLAVAFRVAESAVGEQKEVSCSLSPELSDCNKTIGYYGVLIHVNEHDQAATTWGPEIFRSWGENRSCISPSVAKTPEKIPPQKDSQPCVRTERESGSSSRRTE